MVKIEMSPAQIKKAIKELPVKERIKLIQELEKETREKQFRELLSRVESNLKKYPITEKEIAEEITAVRKKKYAQGRS